MAIMIRISKELKSKINEFRNKGETYNDTINRLYESAVQRQLQEILMSTRGTITIDEAMKRHKSRFMAKG